jgi:hypothetical protein
MYFPISRRVCQYLNCIMSKGRIVYEKDAEGYGHSLFEVLFRHFPRKAEENDGEPQSGSSVARPIFESETSEIKCSFFASCCFYRITI